MEYSKLLGAYPTGIPDLTVYDLTIHGDNRGWFKENWQREKLVALGLPDFGPVQNNISFNAVRGTTRGIHAEPWDKFISLAVGRVFGAWVDLRAGDSFGKVFTTILDPSKAIYVPRGVGNAFQALDDGTAYTYLVNDHWSAEAQREYTFVNLADPQLHIPWPIPLSEAELSDKDRQHPLLAQITPMPPKPILVLGAEGQLGSALHAALPAGTKFLSHRDLDITDSRALDRVPWRRFAAVINAAAYTNVDGAESPDGRRSAWVINAQAVAGLARRTAEAKTVLVQISSDYVFDGAQSEHDEDEAVSPLNVYGQTKAAGEVAAWVNPRHYVVRTSWVIGSGKNFVSTMRELAQRGVSPAVVNDQVGRLTFARDLAEGISFLLTQPAPFGTYNVTNEGTPQSWAEIASRVFELSGRNPDAVTAVTTQQYAAGRKTATRPAHSTLSLDKIRQLGFHARDMDTALHDYLNVYSQ